MKIRPFVYKPVKKTIRLSINNRFINSAPDRRHLQELANKIADIQNMSQKL